MMKKENKWASDDSEQDNVRQMFMGFKVWLLPQDHIGYIHQTNVDYKKMEGIGLNRFTQAYTISIFLILCIRISDIVYP